MSRPPGHHVSPPAGLYIHFPWCVRKCPYCDFNSHPLHGDLNEDAYVGALRTDLRANLPNDARIDSVFFGGGTPSLFSPSAFALLLGDLGERLSRDAEITLEANPGTTEHHNFSGYRAAGINRLSLGAQSFDDDQLAQLGRIHTSAETRRSYARARRAGFENVNLDLMYGLARQTPDAALADLNYAIALEPEHISWYQLTIEPRTEFARRPPVLAAEPDVEAMEERGRELLEAAGYQRYEVSAYARIGRASRHNLNYWTFGDYYGVGAGAHGKLTLPGGIVRTSKARQPRIYLRDPGAVERSFVDPDELIFEFMMNALRLTRGVDFDHFRERTGRSVESLMPCWSRLVTEGLVAPDRILATPMGYRFLDSVLQRFLA